ncbi:LacI family DNA-binding transcriptional regulator [Pseudonocardia sp. 73-21]|jgi:DNA-binding LacI/PurR family transcriptional regulator|uniref:LacI family DNA-binding transcriptional regulator n=1 Tax=Pseudonocardia sp. 73-21 TaxID=1895809 RepID=UPI0009697E0F|nr:LacI family DNA-binding transcriptional regulator [Pseudonocardia sp. 73-21]OJY47134.1 MAG: LacI family transcriptional regulator [Pseudonocardia sp. 73-21]
MSGRPTLAAVAALAGVSPSTASLAFSGSPRVTVATRERVLTAAAELGYAGPDPIAASLRRGRSGVIGAVVGERLLYAFRDPVAIQLLDGITEVLGAEGLGLLLLAGDTGRPSIEQITRIPLDAAIFATCGLEDDPALEALRARGVPVVAVEGPVAEGVTLVDIDDRGGTADLARHLHGLGHRRVEAIAMPLRLDGTRGPVDAARRARAHYRDVRHRMEGVEDVFGPVPIFETASNAVAEGTTAGRILLDVPAHRRPTAVIAQSDVLAAGVLQAAADLGLDVPGDVSVAGFDGADLHWLGATRLTTVVQPTEVKGRAAAQAAIALVAGERPADVVFPVSLRIGTTSGPPPSAM